MLAGIMAYFIVDILLLLFYYGGLELGGVAEEHVLR